MAHAPERVAVIREEAAVDASLQWVALAGSNPAWGTLSFSRLKAIPTDRLKLQSGRK